jgi:GDP-mannose 6-dehydrogenase
MGRALARKTEPHVVVFRSTLVPGTVEDVLRPIVERESGKKDGVDFHLCFQPEFLREGSRSATTTSRRSPWWAPTTPSPSSACASSSATCRASSWKPRCAAAEMMKYCCNNFHALKITFANETARLCGALGVDPFEVMDLVCQDTQLNISKAYLKPGFAFGGSCLPKDLRATSYLAKTHDVEIPMLASMLPSNQASCAGPGQGAEPAASAIGFIGLSFKTGTDDLRESPMVTLAEQLIGKGAQLSIYDPEVHLAQAAGRQPALHRTASAAHRRNWCVPTWTP